MNTLKQLQGEMLKSIYGPDLEVTGMLAELPRDRIAIYRESTRVGLQGTFDTVYEYTRQVFESLGLIRDWESQCQEFLSQNPPRDFRLNWAVHGFWESLKAKPWISELAHYEWVWFEVATERDPSPSDRLNPAVRTLNLDHQIPQWLQSWSTAHKIPARPPKKSPLHLALYRNPVSLEVRTLELTPSAAALLSEWQSGRTPSESIQTLTSALGLDQDLIRTQVESVVEEFRAKRIILPTSLPLTRHH